MVLAVLGSAWLGIGAGLLTRPAFWAGFVPWTVNRVDAQTLGALAEDDLDRTRPALLALPGTAIAAAVVPAFRASSVNWTSGPALGLVCMLTGLLLAGASGRLLLGSVSGDRRVVAAAGAVRRGTPR